MIIFRTKGAVYEGILKRNGHTTDQNSAQSFGDFFYPEPGDRRHEPAGLRLAIEEIIEADLDRKSDSAPRS